MEVSLFPLPLMLGTEVQAEVEGGSKVGVSNPLQVLWSQVPWAWDSSEE